MGKVKRITHDTPGRLCLLRGIPEEKELKYGMDFRLPQYRREVFLRFYGFHLKYRTNPGCVYFLLPYLAKKYGWGEEEKLWFAFLNGNTQNPVTSLLIFRRFPGADADPGGLKKWFDKEWTRLQFDTDRRYHKAQLIPSVRCYRDLLSGFPQKGFFELFLHGTAGENFQRLWGAVRSSFHTFGRLSAFSYLEYLRIVGLPLDCPTLFLRDLDGSKSHRNGLAKVCGRDDLDWHDSNGTGFGGKYSAEVMGWLEGEGEALLGEARGRYGKEDYVGDVGYFTLESCLCTYKSWHRPNRRYPNCYADMLYDRIRWAEERWPGEDLGVFWEARKECLPKNLRLEENPADPGLCPEKQNHYLETGQPVMMDKEYPCFKNDFNDRVDRGES